MTNTTKMFFLGISVVMSFLSCLPEGGKGRIRADKDVFNLILSRIQTENEKNVRANLDAEVQDSLKLWTESGAFSDIDYADTSRTSWNPVIHVRRLYDFALAYTLPNSAYYKDDDLYEKIEAGIRYWYEQNPRSDNWWQNQIGEAQRLGLVLVQMRKGARQIPQELEQDTLERMKTDRGNPADYTGANKTDIALHWLYRACLARDAALLAETIAQAYEPVALASGEGIQHDYSYFQHDEQLYIAGYGSEFIKGVTLFAMYTAGTPYALSGEKLEIFSKFVRETFFAIFRGQYALFGVGGRGLLSREHASFSPGSAVFAERMKQIDPANSAIYDDAISRLRGDQSARYKIAAKHTHYPIGDYTIHTRPGYVFDVRFASTRTGRIEYGNMENLKTYYASDGATNIALEGNEYAGIFSVWNWTRVPGITCVQTPSIPLPPNQWCVYGTSDFAGGVSDSLYGVTAYSYDAGYTGNSAKKAWFFFDDEIVCLGSGITADPSAAAYDINTTVNQCLLNGDVRLSSRGSVSILVKGDHTYSTAPDWILHGGIGYLFPLGGAVALSNKTQRGNWHDINITQADKDVTKDVFTLWLNHGKNAVNGSYVYIVVPGKTTEAEMEDYRQKNAVIIQANTDSIQAVYHQDLDMLGLVFYQAGIFEYGGVSVQVDRPCAILFKDTKTAAVTMHIADPSQSQSQITVLAQFSAAAQKTVCDFTNTGVFAGASKSYTLLQEF
ncbi:chloramphenicol resistance protein [Spirochaetia bacterium]|nr:chloramphenicol resistance protein [Spirochaetia bacterium]